MRINPQVEPLVRTALDAAVKRDFSKLKAALRAFPDDAAARQGVELALAICSFVMIYVHQGKPDDDQIRGLSEELAEMETWAEPTADEIHTFLSKLLNSEPLADSVPTENIIVLAFVVTASLLSSFRKDDEEWWNHLDRVEAALESR